MHRLLRHRPSPALAVSTIALVVALGGAAWAAIPNSNTGVISGCYVTVTSPQTLPGTLRVIDTQAGQTCLPLANEKPLNWNQTGPRGLTGATGATGATGPTGPAGAPAPTPTSYVKTAFGTPGAFSAEVSCNGSDRATGGGGSGRGAAILDSDPLTNGVATQPGQTPNGWSISTQPTTLAVVATVVCEH
jgi:hypothetical protein